METAELEYRLLQDKCTTVIAELLKCSGKRFRGKRITAATKISDPTNDFQNDYFFTATDYFSVIDYLAPDRKEEATNVHI